MYSYQCGRSGCRKRYRFKMPLENYTRIPRELTREGLCGSCGKGIVHSCDKAVRRWNKKVQNLCRCGLPQAKRGGPAPHRPGSMAECAHSPQFNPWRLTG